MVEKRDSQKRVEREGSGKKEGRRDRGKNREIEEWDRETQRKQKKFKRAEWKHGKAGRASR